MVRNNIELSTCGANTSLAGLDLFDATLESREVDLPASLWSWLEADADRHGRSLEEELTWIIREHFAARRQHIPLAEHWPGRR